jgi:predicted nucleic acid-binding protein
MIAVCDIGPLHYLVLIDCDHILPRIFERVITARVVIEQEMADVSAPEAVRRWAAEPPPWLEVLDPREVEVIPSLGKQGMRGDGDRAVISLARELKAHCLIMDDIRARREAKKRGIEPLWTLQLLDEAAERGLVDDLSEKLERLESETSFYVGEKARAVIGGMKQRHNERKLTKNQQTPD